MRFALVNNDTRKVVNCIIWEGAQFLPPKNHFIVRHDLCDMGDHWDEKTNTFFRIAEDGTMTEKSLIASIY